TQPPAAAPAGLAWGTSSAVPHRGRQQPPEGGADAAGAQSLRHVMVAGSAGRYRRRAGRGSPRSGAFHGLHDVEDTRARHDAPSTGRIRTAIWATTPGRLACVSGAPPGPVISGARRTSPVVQSRQGSP